ncbi:MAG: hemerythrin domain-containing protein [Caulobacter sp.]|nr:hemerythrin domain-containing protein [Caulobacter sp.]
MQIQWRDEMAIDHGLIDNDHKYLISIMNEFCETDPTDGSPDRLVNILSKLNAYTTIHFRREEALQRSVHYSYIDAHHHEHGDLLRALYSIHRGLFSLDASPVEDEAEDPAAPSGGPDPATPAGRVVRAHRKVAEFLHHWLIDHIIKSDLRMKPYARDMLPMARGMKPLKQMSAWVDD